MVARHARPDMGMVVRFVLVLGLLVGFGVSQTQAQDKRTTFAYTKGSFERIAAGSWEEKRDDGSVSKFTEVTRTADYIELYDKGRDMKVRLYSNVGKWYSEKDKDWVKWPGSEGSWK